MTAPQQVPLDTTIYLETLEEELTTAQNRARVYRTQVKQLEQMLAKYVQRFGSLDDLAAVEDGVETGQDDARD